MINLIFNNDGSAKIKYKEHPGINGIIKLYKGL